MIEIEGEVILLGDLHFGGKRFNINLFKEQRKYFNEVVYPLMKEKGIKTIIQLGDFLDNRNNINFIFLNELRAFFDDFEKRGYEMITLLGNHDIALRESLDISFMYILKDLYPCLTVINSNTEMKLNDTENILIPWLVDSATIEPKDFELYDSVLGHFEIRDFSMIKGVKDKSSELTEDFFIKGTKVQNVYSGHYHIKDISKRVKYIGTPWQLNWNDYMESKGLYIWDGTNITFKENMLNTKHLKITYNKDGKITIYGLDNLKDIETNLKDITSLKLDRHKIKFLKDNNTNKDYKSLISLLKNVLIIDNTYDEEHSIMEQDDNSLSNNRDIILHNVTKLKPNLTKKVSEILGRYEYS